MKKQDQKLSLELQVNPLRAATELENEQLQGLVGSDIIFQTIVANKRVLGNLTGVGEHFLFVKNVKILVDYSLTKYLSGEATIAEHVLNIQQS